MSEKERQRAKAAATRSSERDITPEAVVSQRRRKQCEHDDPRFLREYMPDVFYNPFTSAQEQFICDVGRSLRFGTLKAKAMPRGGGKSTIVKYLQLKYALYRQLRFPLILAATTSKARQSLRDIKEKLRSNRDLHQDFPFDCSIARYVAPAAARANNVTYGGLPVRVEWAPDHLILPSLPHGRGKLAPVKYGLPADCETLGPILMCLGFTSDSLQGLNVYDVRPDFVMLDDLDSRDSLSAEHGIISQKIEECLDKTVSGLGGPNRQLGRVFICTITSRRSAAFRYTEPSIKPAWDGERIPRIITWPDAIDTHWAKYIDLRQEHKRTDVYGRIARDYLIEHFDEMHKDAVLSNEYDFNSAPLEDGEAEHLSALQKCFDFIADNGMDAFQTEHQNQPPAETEISRAGISRELVASRLSGLARRELPPDCTIAIGCDVGKRFSHFVVGAVRSTGHIHIVDYGIVEVVGAEQTAQVEVIERAIVRALSDWRDSLTSNPYRDADDNPVAPCCVLIDAGYSQTAVLEFVGRYADPFRAAKGSSRFHHGVRSQTRRVGNRWFSQPQYPSRVWLHSLDADFWKKAVHDRFVTQPLDENNRPNAGALTLFIPAGRRDHHTYASHIIAEEWITEDVPGKGERSRWLVHSGNNHYLDATSLMLAAAEMAGVGIFAKPKRLAPSARPTAQQLAGR